MNRTTEADHFGTSLDATSAEIPQSRRDFDDWLHMVGVDDEAASELTIVYSELVANAIEASREGPIEARAWLEDGEVVLEVANPIRSPGPPVRHRNLDDPLRPAGRGLVIVEAYTDSLDVDLTDGPIVLRCRREVSG